MTVSGRKFLLERIDVFGEAVPGFNLKGNNKVNTITGGIFSIFLYTVMFMYGLVRLQQLRDRHNPLISESTEIQAFSSSDKLNLNEIGFHFAFSIENYLTREQKADPRFVKYIVQQVGKNDGKDFVKVLPFHKCTEEDWKKFPPP